MKLGFDGYNEVSPPARVAWIETRICARSNVELPVATREGGVDRNRMLAVTLQPGGASPPARVAWIETGLCGM